MAGIHKLLPGGNVHFTYMNESMPCTVLIAIYLLTKHSTTTCPNIQKAMKSWLDGQLHSKTLCTPQSKLSHNKPSLTSTINY